MAFAKNFKLPESDLPSDYTKIEDGENRLRILSEIITGNLYWTGDIRKNEERKPVRKRDNEEINMGELGYGKYGDDEVRTFVACVVWNYQTKKIEVFETDKFSILRELWDLEQDIDWGDLRNYDVSISKTGQNKETRYKVNPKPGKPVAPEITEALKNKPINLEALFDGGNPFEAVKEATMSPKAVDDITDQIPF